MSLGFDLSLTGAAQALARGRNTPWWHSYRAGPDGALPDTVVLNETQKIHGAPALNGWTLDLSGHDLSAGVSVLVQGALDYTPSSSGFPRIVEIGSASTDENRQSLMVAQSSGQIRIASRTADVTQMSSGLAGSVAPAESFRIAARFAADDFALHKSGAPAVTDTAGSFPGAALDRLYLRSSAGNTPKPGFLDLVVVWAQPLTDAELIGLL